MSVNDCLFTEQVFLNEHEQPYYSFDRNNEFSVDDDSFKIINSVQSINDGEMISMKQSLHDHELAENDWVQNDDYQWIPPDPDPPPTNRESILQCINRLHKQFQPNSDVMIEREQQQQIIETIKSTSTSTSTKIQLLLQLHTGANTSATNNISLLEDIVYIRPVNINSATINAPMRMLAVGRITLSTTSGDVLKPICYYSPDIDGTIYHRTQ